MMRRREFITLIGGVAAWPIVARAQQPTKLPTVGYLGVAPAASTSQWRAAFEQRLRELGWIEGRTIAIEYRWAELRTADIPEIVAEFVRLKVDVIVTPASGAVVAKEITSVIPIVFTVAQHPIGGGLVASLARPGGNVTGLSAMHADLAGKRIELLHEAVPDFRRLAILVDVGNSGAVLEMAEAQTEASKLGLHVVTSAIRRAEDIAPAFEAIDGQADALYVCGAVLTFSYRIRINNLALGLRLPAIFPYRNGPETGGLMSYGPNFPSIYRRAADYVDKILRGAKPGDIPVEQPTNFELIINLKTAKALDLDVPPTLLARADEVIE
jgi:putative tryptophan/tyrosine transport system substrate-binding protein